jgi:hypothetical protein
MSDTLLGWSTKGFWSPPQKQHAPEGGRLVYRCWGGQSTLWGNGFFSDQKPTSVRDAELRFNIADWGNTIYFVSTFRVAPGVPYWIGSVFQPKVSLSRTGLQIFISPPLATKLQVVVAREPLRQDARVIGKPADDEGTEREREPPRQDAQMIGKTADDEGAEKE